jgi:DNA repair exonuclease SbcCD nuclease subunit
MTLLRFVQTGDWHLGQAYRWAGAELAERLRSARLEAVSRVLEAAERLGAAFVLATGDQFDGPRPAPRLVSALLERIGAHPWVPVHMIPGNHDPCGVGSVYTLGAFKARPANLHFHDRPGPVVLAEHEATLYPCPCSARFGPDPMEWIPPRGANDGWRIGLAHGSLPFCADAENRNYPIRADAPRRFDLDYVALGDWHKPTPDPRENSRARMYYAGAPEVGGWDEPGAGHALEVVLEPDAEPRVTAHRVGRHEWAELLPALHDAADVARLAERLDELAQPERLVRVRATGALIAKDRDRLAEACEQRSGLFASLELDDEGLAFLRDGEDELPFDPLIRETYRRLQRLATDPADGAPTGLPKDVAQPDADVIERAINRFRGLLPG